MAIGYEGKTVPDLALNAEEMRRLESAKERSRASKTVLEFSAARNDIDSLKVDVRWRLDSIYRPVSFIEACDLVDAAEIELDGGVYVVVDPCPFCNKPGTVCDGSAC